MRPTESAVLVRVPEAEPVVGGFRSALDPAAGLGVPAHVTVLYPFVAPARIEAGVLSGLAAAVRSVAAFDVTFARLTWFARSVLWLAPEPAGPFRALTAAVCGAFPGYLPYGGEHSEVVPHLTVGMDRPEEVLESAAAQIAPALPITARVGAVTLMHGSPAGPWSVVAELPLGPGSGPGSGPGPGPGPGPGSGPGPA